MLKLNILRRYKQKMRQKIAFIFLKSCFLTFFYEFGVFCWEIFSGF
jgi:TRAP-type C4-dicarboxylate transport system permease small subunit